MERIEEFKFNTLEASQMNKIFGGEVALEIVGDGTSIPNTTIICNGPDKGKVMEDEPVKD